MSLLFVIVSELEVVEYKGTELKLTDISRHEMGHYLCIASNGIPPAILKRIMVAVQCKPPLPLVAHYHEKRERFGSYFAVSRRALIPKSNAK